MFGIRAMVEALLRIEASCSVGVARVEPEAKHQQARHRELSIGFTARAFSRLILNRLANAIHCFKGRLASLMAQAAKMIWSSFSPPPSDLADGGIAIPPLRSAQTRRAALVKPTDCTSIPWCP